MCKKSGRMINESNRAMWEWRLSVLKKLRTKNRTNLEIRHMQTALIKEIEYDLRSDIK